MKFKRQVKFESGLAQFDMTPVIDVIFLLLIFFMLSSSFTFQSGIHVKLPKAVTSDVIKEENFTISITSENIIYFNGKVTSLIDLKQRLQSADQKDVPVMIRADRRSSMGRIVDVWDLCRELGIQKINIATNTEQ
jgi:biopolymer transport protein ExbD